MVKITHIPVCTEHTVFDNTCPRCWTYKYAALAADVGKLKRLIALRLPENSPDVSVGNWSEYLDDWEEQVRDLLGRKYG